jgi:hypothetical protein
MSARGELLGEWVADLRAALERELSKTTDEALHWRPGREMNSIGDTVWHVARWLDLVSMWLQNAAPERQRWIADGWAERTGYDPRGIGTDGIGAISGYTFAEVETIPKLRRDQLLQYLGSVSDDLVARLRTADEAASKRYKSVLQGAFGHAGEIAAIRTLYERRAG